MTAGISRLNYITIFTLINLGVVIAAVCLVVLYAPKVYILQIISILACAFILMQYYISHKFHHWYMEGLR
jgi:hypothetical protein